MTSFARPSSPPTLKRDYPRATRMVRDATPAGSCAGHCARWLPSTTWKKGEDAAASRTGSGPADLATTPRRRHRGPQNADYPHIPEGRRDHTTPAETLRLHVPD
jgi:hypothetical protein